MLSLSAGPVARFTAAQLWARLAAPAALRRDERHDGFC